MAGDIQPMRGAQSEVSEDQRIWTIQSTIGVYGVYDPEKQPTPEEIIAMKAEFNRKDTLDNAAPKVCTRIVLDMLTTTDKSGSLPNDETAIRAGITDADGATVYFKNRYKNVFDLAEDVGYLSGSWMQDLTQASALPGSEWPEDFSPPAIFAEELKEVKAEEIIEKTRKLVNKLRFAGDHSSTFTVDAVTQLEVESKDPEAEPLYLCKVGLVRAIAEGKRYELEQFTVDPDTSVLRMTQTGHLLGDERLPDEGSQSERRANLVELLDIANRLSHIYTNRIN
ncbi:hypothetical protein HYS01_03605 [Candidatus Saccharibacteria bacterium]|nr:hypothetical protein [Candidatus Saccharibacteria bacterium]